MAGMVSSARMMNSSDRGLNHYRNVSPVFQAISEFCYLKLKTGQFEVEKWTPEQEPLSRI
jgi:hypothetical protein